MKEQMEKHSLKQLENWLNLNLHYDAHGFDLGEADLKVLRKSGIGTVDELLLHYYWCPAGENPIALSESTMAQVEMIARHVRDVFEVDASFYLKGEDAPASLAEYFLRQRYLFFKHGMAIRMMAVKIFQSCEGSYFRLFSSFYGHGSQGLDSDPVHPEKGNDKRLCAFLEDLIQYHGVPTTGEEWIDQGICGLVNPNYPEEILMGIETQSAWCEGMPFRPLQFAWELFLRHEAWQGIPE
jgi:hypothetical protein